MKKTLRIGLVVGEVSGENLALSLIEALRKELSDKKYEKQYELELEFEGVLGPRLIAAGGKALYPMERLSVMGLIEPLKRLPELFLMRRRLIKHFLENPPDIFIGIDAPDFNLGLEKKLKAAGIFVVHYVSPSVWAWRQGRIHGIKKSIDLMLALLPFEAKFYQKHAVPVCFTGHPIADQIPLISNEELAKKTIDARKKLNLDPNKPTIAILPGSRNMELKYLASIFLQTAQLCYQKNPDLQFIMPLASEKHQAQIQVLQQAISSESSETPETPKLPIKIVVNQSHLAVEAADCVLLASGTATLEVMLHKKPMVVAYRMHPINYQIANRLVKVPYISLPNLLAEDFVVPEFIQDKAQPEALANALLERLAWPKQKIFDMVENFNAIHQRIRKNASYTAAQAILDAKKGRNSKS